MLQEPHYGMGGRAARDAQCQKNCFKDFLILQAVTRKDSMGLKQTLKVGGVIHVGDAVITICGARGSKVFVHIVAPAEIPIVRDDVLSKRAKANERNANESTC